MSAALMVSACTSNPDEAAITITSNMFVTAKPTPGSTAATSTGKSDATTKYSSSGKPTTKPDPSKATTSAGTPAGALPDGFVPKKLKPGEKAPQFIVVSFDGVGWHEKWQYWFDIMKKVPFHFTGFLSGTYMLSDATKAKYQGPGHGPGDEGGVV